MPTGRATCPLLGETIGANLRRTVERFGEREALVVAPPALPRHLPRAVARGRLRGASAARPRRRQGRPRRHLGAEPLRVGRDAVRHRARRRDPRHRQPRLQGGRAGARARQGRRQPARHGPRLPAGGLRRDARGVATPRCDTIVLEDDWDAFLAEGARVADAELAEREATLQFDDPINIQYTSGTTGAPKGATLTHHNILNNAYFSGARAGLQRARPGVRPGAASTTPSAWCSAPSPASTHGACMVVPGESFDAGAVLETVAAERCTVALRRADDVHRRARASATSSASTSPACGPG